MLANTLELRPLLVFLPRALCACWPPDLFETGRVQITGTFINQTWITGAVMYGYPQGKVHHNALARSSDMLEFLIGHMTQVAPGPRYLCGDLNHELEQLPVLQRLVQLGWREAQDLECLRTGSQPQPTCKECTRKDMLWISPELVPFFRCALVDHDRFADHSVLRAYFAQDGALSKRYLWPKPKPVPWNLVPPLTNQWILQRGHPLRSTSYCGKPRNFLPKPSWENNEITKCRAEAKELPPSCGRDGLHHRAKVAPVIFNLPSMGTTSNIAGGYASCADCITTIAGRCITMAPPLLINNTMAACFGLVS